MDDRMQTLRVVLRNGLTWGAAWALAGGAIACLLTLINPGPGVESLIERLGVAVFAGFGWGIRFGIIGAVIGTAFSSIIRMGYRGRRLAEINPLRFTLLGAVVGGVGVPLFLQLMNLLTGGGAIAWRLVLDDGIWATVFGGGVAASLIYLARRAEQLHPVEPPAELENGSQLGKPAFKQPSRNLSDRR